MRVKNVTISHYYLQIFEFSNHFLITYLYTFIHIYEVYTFFYTVIFDHLVLCIFSFQDDSRRTAPSAITETGPPAMPRLPSCCPQHSPCGGSSQSHHALGHPHASCFQQHGHHFQHHHHHHHTPHPAVPVSPSFGDPTCPVERPPQVQAPCGANSSSGTSYHDQVCGI